MKQETMLKVGRFVRAISTVMLFTVITGCVNIVGHLSSTPYKPYEATVESAKGVVEIFTEVPEWHHGNYAEAMYAHVSAVFLAPFVLTAAVVEPVADTITLPYDLFRK